MKINNDVTIAKFMGLNLKKDVFNGVEYYYYNDPEEQDDLALPDYKLWNNLMPVVEKIENTAGLFCIMDKTAQVLNICITGETKLEAVYQVVCSYINRINTIDLTIDIIDRDDDMSKSVSDVLMQWVNLVNKTTNEIKTEWSSIPIIPNILFKNLQITNITDDSNIQDTIETTINFKCDEWKKILDQWSIGDGCKTWDSSGDWNSLIWELARKEAMSFVIDSTDDDFVDDFQFYHNGYLDALQKEFELARSNNKK